MRELQIFNSSQFGEVRVTTTEKGEPVFCLADVCSILDLRQGDVRQRLDDGVVSTQPIVDSLGRTQHANFVNEDGLYDVILDSRKPEAKSFRKWVTGDVIPSIRKHGAYMTQDTIEKVLSDPDTIIRLATNLKEERRQRELAQEQVRLQQRSLKEAAPKVEYHDKVLQSASLFPINVIAKELGMSAKTLNQKLTQMGVQYKSGGSYVLTHRHQHKGYTGTKTYSYTDHNGHDATSIHTYWTQRGRAFIHSLFNGKATHVMHA